MRVRVRLRVRVTLRVRVMEIRAGHSKRGRGHRGKMNVKEHRSIFIGTGIHNRNSTRRALANQSRKRKFLSRGRTKLFKRRQKTVSMIAAHNPRSYTPRITSA